MAISDDRGIDDLDRHGCAPGEVEVTGDVAEQGLIGLHTLLSEFGQFVVDVMRQHGAAQLIRRGTPVGQLVVELIESSREHRPTERATLGEQAIEPTVKGVFLKDECVGQGAETSIFAPTSSNRTMARARDVARKHQNDQCDDERE